MRSLLVPLLLLGAARSGGALDPYTLRDATETAAAAGLRFSQNRDRGDAPQKVAVRARLTLPDALPSHSRALDAAFEPCGWPYAVVRAAAATGGGVEYVVHVTSDFSTPSALVAAALLAAPGSERLTLETADTHAGVAARRAFMAATCASAAAGLAMAGANERRYRRFREDALKAHQGPD